jgi:glycerol-3-phosphate acyltransferase PlsY
MAIALAILAAYLLGSIPFGLVLARLRHIDLRSVGSGNIGATNAARALGKRLGLLVLLLDAGKAVLPIWLCRRYFGDRPELESQLPWLLCAVGAAAFIGHLLPIFAGFRGGKGVATAFGCFLALEPRAALLSLVVYIAAYGISRISSVGSLVAVGSFPLFLYLTAARQPSYVLAAGLLVLILVRHLGNIQRLLARREPKV